MAPGWGSQPLERKRGLSLDAPPDFMFEHAGQGYAGHGTLCGALGVSSRLINLVIYDKDCNYAPVINWMIGGTPRCSRRNGLVPSPPSPSRSRPRR